MNILYKLKNINLNYLLNDNNIKILKNINFEIKKNERVAIIGESGSGKTSLLMLMSGLESPTNGSIVFDKEDLSKINEKRRTEIRRKKIGLIFQQFFLIPNYTALENVMFPMQINKIDNEKEKAISILEDFGLVNRKNNLPSELSGGEQQRVAIARALIAETKLILADEPTGNLDFKTSKEIFSLFLKLKKLNKTIIFATHNRELANRADYKLFISDGNIKRVNVR